MTDLNKFRSGAYERYQSDPEVLAAIEEVADEELPQDGAEDDEDAESEAYRIWADPTPDEMAAVKAAAFRLTEEDALAWGISKIKRA